MPRTVADQFADTLAAAGVKRVYGIVGDSLNGLCDAIRRQGKIEWLHVRREEVAAFAAGAEAKMGTTAAQKKLFFNLRKLKSKLQAIDDGDLSPENVEKIATDLKVSEEDVINMNRRLAAPDHSLNAPVTIDGDGEWQDWLVDETDGQEIVLAKQQELSKRRKLLSHAMKSLDRREHHIFAERCLKDEPTTLEALSKEYGITRERVRQIEVRAFEKVQRAIKGGVIERANRHDGDAVETVRNIQREPRRIIATKWRA